METPKDKEVAHSGRYDKRFILKIVQEVESGLPRNEIVELHNLSNNTLKEWMRDYGSVHYHNNLKRKSYSRAQKRSVVAAIEQGRMSIKQAQVAYQIKSERLIRNWVKQEKLDLYTVIDPAMVKKKNLPKSNNEVEELQKALQEAELRIKALNTLIDVAEEQLKIDIRKKPGAKQSKK